MLRTLEEDFARLPALIAAGTAPAASEPAPPPAAPEPAAEQLGLF